jgi:hypothetical protein
VIERESKLPLVIGGVFALLLHAAMVPVLGVGLSGASGRSPAVPPKQDNPLPPARELEAGRAHASVTNMAWIAYDDYRELLAKHAIIEQPALQKQQDPAPSAPIEMDPTPPAPTAAHDAKPAMPGTESGGDTSMSLSASRAAPIALPLPGTEGEIPYAPHGQKPRDAVAITQDAPDPTDNTESPDKSQPDDPGAPTQNAKPTAAPRDEAEAQPVTIYPGLIRVRPGAVLTADGIEIKTVLIRPSMIARYSSIPRNPKATLWFNREGIVTHVDLTRSTGADNWDEPVITAFEQWTATGEQIENLNGEIQFKVELLMSSE